ncbi:MAG: hypothetical protein ABSA46_20570 [Thermodesulfovibrionales bacterium]|jgi:hypothetical protein
MKLLFLILCCNLADRKCVTLVAMGTVMLSAISSTARAEMFNFTAKSAGGESETGFNIGALTNITAAHHILFSTGVIFTGQT